MAKASEPKATKGKRKAGQLVGYLRVSSLDQESCASSRASLWTSGLQIKASSKDLHRPQLEQLTGYVREGDTVICHAMDRLAAT